MAFSCGATGNWQPGAKTRIVGVTPAATSRLRIAPSRMSTDPTAKPSRIAAGLRPFRTAVLRGLGVVAAPLLTLVILLWIVRTVDYYILEPVVAGTKEVLSRELADIRSTLPEVHADRRPNSVRIGRQIVQAAGKWPIHSPGGLRQRFAKSARRAAAGHWARGVSPLGRSHVFATLDCRAGVCGGVHRTDVLARKHVRRRIGPRVLELAGTWRRPVAFCAGDLQFD